MANSAIPRRKASPEFVTQTVQGYAALRYSGSMVVTPTITSGINSISVSSSSYNVSSATFNVAKAGYTLVGISYTTSRSYYSGNNSDNYLAGFHTSTGSPDEFPARIQVSGNNLILTPCSTSVSSGEYTTTTVPYSSGATGRVYLGKIICTYIKD